MSTNRFMLNETSYFGRGAREVLPEELKNRGYKKIFVVTDKALVGAGVTAKVTDVLTNAGIDYMVYEIFDNQNNKYYLSATAKFEKVILKKL